MTDRPQNLPTDLPIVERDVVRLVVRDANDHVLLFHTRDSTDPELGTCWELPGGGIEVGETYVDTAIRELREETGITIGPNHLGRPTWRRDATYRYRGERRLQHEQVLTVQLDGSAPTVQASQRDPLEEEDCFESRWWPVGDILASGEQFYPGRLPTLLAGFLDGENIEEPFELWS